MNCKTVLLVGIAQFLTIAESCTINYSSTYLDDPLLGYEEYPAKDLLIGLLSL